MSFPAIGPVVDELLSGLPGTICAAIRLALPDLRECVPHGGRFDLAELKSFSARAPSVRVAVLGLGREREIGGPAWEYDLRLAAFVVVTDRPGLPRHEAAVAITQRLVTLIGATRWAASIGQARGVAADNLYSSGLREQGVALWGVSWVHSVQLHPTPSIAGPLPSRLYATGLGPAADDPVEVTA